MIKAKDFTAVEYIWNKNKASYTKMTSNKLILTIKLNILLEIENIATMQDKYKVFTSVDRIVSI